MKDKKAVFIKKSNEKHHNKYDYSKVNYINSETKVCIICPEHGEFWQTPYKHISGQGCGRCRQSHLEREVRLFLQNKKIDFKEQKMFSWLGLKRLDFYLTNYNIAIECQGIQHFKPIDDFGGKKAFIELKMRDKTKRDLCQKHNINLLYFSHENIKFPYVVYTDINILFEKIKEIIDFSHCYLIKFYDYYSVCLRHFYFQWLYPQVTIYVSLYHNFPSLFGLQVC